MKTEDPSKEEGNSSKVTSRISPYPYCGVYLFPLLSLFCTYNNGLAWDLVIPAFLLIVFPALELLCGQDGYNPTKQETKDLENLFSFRLITWLWVPFQLLFLLSTSLLLCRQEASLLHIVMVSISVGILTGGIGITVAHELIHKNSAWEQSLGKILLTSVMYLHFYPEHLLGHHKKVATKEDPATSRFGETLYQFIPRTIFYSYLSAWKIEAKRMQKSNRPTVSWDNVMFQEMVYTAAIIAALILSLGRVAAVFWILQSFMGILMLEMVNYVEHYGLQRKEHGGNYERVSPFHSWNADHWASNIFIFKLQRHADHHAWPHRRYQILRNWEMSPQLPTGYTGMFVLALFPPLYFSVMNPKVERYNSWYHAPTAPSEFEQNLIH